MKKTYKLFGFLIMIIFIACDEIFEEDITNDVISVLYPTDGVTVETNIVSFQWVNMAGANTYRIQIINDIQSIVIDSLVNDNSFYLSLLSDDYTWRVRGENDAYVSTYNFPTSFKVDIAKDLTNLVILLDNPSANIYTNSSTIIYAWYPLANATNYDFELVKSLGGNSVIYQEYDLISTSITLQSDLYSEDAEYKWKVKGTNDNSQTIFSERSFFLDRISPNQPILNSPVIDGIGSNPITFNWSLGVDIGNIQSVVTSTFQIADDNSFNNIIYTNDNAGETQQFQFNSLGDYYWRVKAFDAVGNESDFSDSRKITVE